MDKQIEIVCNYRFKDYFHYCTFPNKTRKTYKLFIGVCVVCIAILLYNLIINILNNSFDKNNIIILSVVSGLLIFVILFVLIKLRNQYNKAKSAFLVPLSYSFLNNQVMITSNKEKGSVNLYLENIKFVKVEKKYAFIVLKNDKFYMCRTDCFVKGNIYLLQNWVVEHHKEYKK